MLHDLLPVRYGAQAGPGTEERDHVALTIATTLAPTRIRRTIATRLGQSYREAVHVSTRRAIGLDGARELAAATRVADSSSRVGLVDVIVAALAKTLIDFPAFNATVDADGHHFVSEVNIGLAVDSPYGLVVPVLKDVPSLPLLDLSEARRTLTDRVLGWTQGLDDLADGTFTVSNLGPLGVDEVDPIINPPQTAILGIGRMRQELSLEETTGALSTRNVATFSLVFDHRVHDGADAARFLGALAAYIERPDSFPLERKESRKR